MLVVGGREVKTIGRQAAQGWPQNGRDFFCLDADLPVAGLVAAVAGVKIAVDRLRGLRCQGRLSRCRSWAKEGEMSSVFTIVFQVIGVILQIGNWATGIVPEKYRWIVGLVVALAQAVQGYKAHFVNPDGSPAALPYVAPR